MQFYVRFVNLPGPQSSGKYGSIVNPQGQKIMVPADMLPHFRAGMTCEVATKTQMWGQNQVLVATSPPGSFGQGGGGQQGGGGYHSQQPRNGTSYGARQAPSGGFDAKSTPREMFIQGVVGRSMGSGKFAASEISVLTHAAAAAWDEVVLRKRPDLPPDRLDDLGQQGGG